ncbi:MAG TPA: MFS transporter [Solirubrobacteraceae bacterium]|jgi:EmrB/QacA subfamily drug resistance transporter|nr:MFS transporter [Solirubrobacteraceae bacterium]
MQDGDEVTQQQAADDGGVSTLAGAADTPAAGGPGAVTVALPSGKDGVGARLRASGSRSTWILAVCCVAQFMVILDLSIVNVALPSIQSSLNFSSADLQWVVDAYAITFAGFLMLGGRVVDSFGHRRTFTVALLLFGLTSLAGGLSPDSTFLVVARGVQGFSCAFMAASSLAIITASFPPGPKLHRAIALWAAMNGLGGAAGMLFGGIITQELSWRWVLLINPPIGIAAAFVAYAVVHERRRARAGGSFDLSGAITLTVGQMVLVYGVVETGIKSWHAFGSLGPMIAGIVLLAAFCVIEVRASEPLIPFKELTKPLRDANTIVLLFSASLFPMWFVSSLYLQQVLGLSPLHAGLIFLPMALLIMLVASRAGRLVSHFGVRAVLVGGLVMLTTGLLLLSKIAQSGSPVLYVMLPGLLTTAGIGLSIVASTIAATHGAKEGQAGLASGLVNTSRQVGGGIGLALLVTLATQRTSHLIGAGHPVPESLTDGFRLAYLIGAGFAGAAGLYALATLPKPPADTARRRPLLATIGAVVAVFVTIQFAVVSGTHGAEIGRYVKHDAYSFVSEPGLHPPILKADVAPKNLDELAPGYLFLTNFYNLSYPPLTGQSGPLILDKDLAPVWFHPVPESVVAANLSLQSYHGKPALAWWQGVVTNAGATTSGEDVIVNQHYQPIATVRGKDGWIITLHDLVISGDDAWVTANKNIPMNLSKYGGAYNGALTDSAVQEYSLKTGKLVRSWDALDHIPLGDSRATLPTNGFPWDAYHVNAIDLTGHGTFMVSMRDTWAAYLVNIATGRIIWTLGGPHSSFTFGPGADFQWQHDVKLGPGSEVTLFDDHCCQITGGGTYVSASAPSRGLVLRLNQQTHTATLVSQYSHGSSFDADYMGSTQQLANGNVLVGWGSQRFFSEYSPSGKMLLDVVLPGEDLSYRTTLGPWVGLPLQPPAGAARASSGGATVYASWNGATRVVSWRVLGGTSADALAPVATAAKVGFETAIAVHGSNRTFEVQALDARRRVIGISRPFALSG